MKKLRAGDLCPRCREGKIWRTRRRDWMRKLPQSKLYRCRDCRARFLSIWGWGFRLPSRPRPAEIGDN